MIGEPLALDLLNTLPEVDGRQIDCIATPAALRDWVMRQADRFPGIEAAEVAALGEGDLAAVRAVRAHLGVVIRALWSGAAVDAGALAGLNDALRAAPAVKALEVAEGKAGIVLRRVGTLGERLAAALAEAALELIDDRVLARIRECAAQDCVMLFLASHPRRQWCSAERCGNRARVARYYRRHKRRD